eukprot:m.294405 g.294405  ORF g.294405 m.294405 type:complete len:421 (+) comp40746_c0_seq3:1006-2268(+)
MSEMFQHASRLIMTNADVSQSLSKRWRSDPNSTSSPHERNRPSTGAFFNGEYHYCRKWGHKTAASRKRQFDERRGRLPSSQSAPSPRRPATQERTENVRLTGGNAVFPTVNAVQSPSTNPTCAIRTRLPTCILQVEGAPPVACFIDSGSEYSLTSADFAAQLGAKDEGDDNSVSLEPIIGLYAAQGEAMTISGRVTMALNVGELQLEQRFIIVQGLVFAVLLGCDFMCATGAKFDFGTGSLTLGKSLGREVQLPLFGLFADRDGAASIDPARKEGRILAITAAGRTPGVVQLGTTKETSPSNGLQDVHPIWKPSSKVTVADVLSENQRHDIVALVDAYADVFSTGTQDLGRLTSVTHRIDTGDMLTGAIKVHPTSGVLVHEAMTNGEKLQVPFLPAALRSQVLEVLHSVPMSVTWDTGRR